MLRSLPKGLQSWVLTALRKRSGELKTAFKLWLQNANLPSHTIKSEKIVRILMKKSNQIVLENGDAMFESHSEEDLETLRDWCFQNATPNKEADLHPHESESVLVENLNLPTKIAGLTSRVNMVQALNALENGDAMFESHSEEDLETLRDWCFQNATPNKEADLHPHESESVLVENLNLPTKIAGLTSRVNMVQALNALRIKRFEKNHCVLFQGHGNGHRKSEASYMVMLGEVELLMLSESFTKKVSERKRARLLEDEHTSHY